MKQKHSAFFALTAAWGLIFLFAAFTALKPDTYKVDLSQSTLSWEGKKLVGSHKGTVALTSGTLIFNGKTLIEGGFIANMTTIQDADKNSSLEKHLKSDDFFGVSKYPAANFIIKKVTGKGTNLNITGDLTIKGVTHAISFPAVLTWNADKTVTAVAEKIVVDRTKFGIEFRSKSIFSTLGDNFIEDEFTLSVKLLAKPSIN